jgi:uncharacterized protein YdaU (DUF1376 family)
MSNPPAFQTYASDFYMDTAGWDPYALGIYWRLLMYEWVNNDLPSDINELARISGSSLKKFDFFWKKNVCSKFQLNGHQKLINRRMEEVRQTQTNYSESRRKNVMHRYQKQFTYVDDMNLHSDYSSSSTSSLLNTKDNKTSISHSETKEFLTFYRERFKTEFEKDPVVEWGKDGKIIKGLLKFIPFAELKELLIKFFESKDKFIQNSGYTIGVFKSQLNKLRIGESTKDGIDLWLDVKDKQDETRRQKEVRLLDAKTQSNIPDESKRKR